MNDINQKNEHNQQAQDVEPGRINSDTITGNYASSFEHKDYVENTQHDSIANENKWIPEKHDDGFFTSHQDNGAVETIDSSDHRMNANTDSQEPSMTQMRLTQPVFYKASDIFCVKREWQGA